MNGEPVDLHMKLGDNGEAFFVQEAEQQNVSMSLKGSFTDYQTSCGSSFQSMCMCGMYDINCLSAFPTLNYLSASS